ncbi:hypothetical protein BJX66DRAFT_238014 [Aspergillus keveii]|uniref:Uncharacterized protein n=1 Tax=Aspergillus keveii TaxID=714993 RepID=A0ABR4G163_9EURO
MTERNGETPEARQKCNRAAAAITGAAQNLVQQEESSNYQGRFASHGCVPSIQPTGQRHIVCLMVASHRIKSSSFLDTLSSSGPLRPRPIFLLSFLLPYPSCLRSEWWGMSLAGLWLFNLYVSLLGISRSPYITQLLPFLIASSPIPSPLSCVQPTLRQSPSSGLVSAYCEPCVCSPPSSGSVRFLRILWLPA